MRDSTGMTRRHLLATAAALATLPLPAFSWPLDPGGFHCVNGWILTTKDVENLRRHAV